MAELAAAVTVLGFVVSVAVRTQAEPASMMSDANVAVPDAAVAATVPPRVHPEVMVIVSVRSFEATAPAPFSTDTANDVRGTPEVAVTGGATE
ncbi:MAG: hypothetical protein ABSC34_00680 [Acidimicrobiales bacterium]|jgi:hypothetical protein